MNEVGEVGIPPQQYRTDSGIQPFDVYDAYGFSHYEASALKYLFRLGKKHDDESDLRKSRHYLAEAILRAPVKISWIEVRHPQDGLSVQSIVSSFGLTDDIAQVVSRILASKTDDEPRYWLRKAAESLDGIIKSWYG
jgi:Protein of unknwon function (DUF3310)